MRHQVAGGARTTAPLGNADRVRGTLGLVFGELVRAGGLLVEHPRLREIYPDYLFTLHTMVRAAVPMLETGRDREIGRAHV